MQLPDVLGPREESEFLYGSLADQMFTVTGRSGFFDGLLGWPDINRVLRSHALPKHSVVVTKGGRRVPDEAYTQVVPRYPDQLSAAHLTETRLCARALGTFLRNGASLALNGLEDHHGPLAELIRDLEARLRVRVYANAYMAWGDTSGLSAHWDDHDVLVLQISGRKHWSVLPPTQPFPMEGAGTLEHPPAMETARGIVLTAGDVLYLPRGWWHLVTPVNEPSLHLTLGFTRRTGAHFMEWLAADLRKEVEFRRDLPRGADAGDRQEHLTRLRAALTRYLDDPGILDRYFAVADERCTRNLIDLTCDVAEVET
ncbi:cupin domain-containing protein [Streptomyces sp. NPDC088752]|uniref:cupin domain-containing protein n=1 Tax=Streptomyces sp. NPDC088752 TaxID=3154963 RepID=UPI003436A2FD